MLRTRIGLLLCLGCGWVARADGGLFFTSVAGGSSGDQHAAILSDGTRETLVLQTAAVDPETP